MGSVSATHDLSQNRPGSKWPIRIGWLAAVLVGFYALAFAGFDCAMHQPPQTFSRLMMHTGPIPFLLFPFESMWKDARRGHLNVGDEAPDFTLPLLDHSARVSPSSFRGREPVVLIFGSYT